MLLLSSKTFHRGFVSVACVCAHIVLCLMEWKCSKYYFLTYYFHLGKVVLIAIDNEGKDQTSYFFVKRAKKMEIVKMVKSLVSINL